MICKVCGRECHYCTSCDPDFWMNSGVCGQGCFDRAVEERKSLAEQVRDLRARIEKLESSGDAE